VSEAAPQSPAGTPVTPRRSALRRILRWLAGIGAVFVILLALLVGAMRIAMTHLPEYRDRSRPGSTTLRTSTSGSRAWMRAGAFMDRSCS